MSTGATRIVREEPPTRPSGTVPGSVPHRVLTALQAETNPVRPADIATKIGMSSTQVANALRVLTLRGEVVRLRNTMVRNGPGASEYVATTNVRSTESDVASGVTSGVG